MKTLDKTIHICQLVYYKDNIWLGNGDIWISRSQAKKVLSGLDKYKKIIFDFAGIEVIGQAFADEIFRVFNIHHPNIILEPINMSESVALMVSRAQNDQTGRK